MIITDKQAAMLSDALAIKTENINNPAFDGPATTFTLTSNENTGDLLVEHSNGQNVLITKDGSYEYDV